MVLNKDWLPRQRQQRANMAHTWLDVLSEPAYPDEPDNETMKAEAWNVPNGVVSDLGDATNRADESLIDLSKKETRTEVAVAVANTAFDELAALMRDIKKRYFYAPPLVNADLVALGLRLHDATPTRTGTPTAEFAVETFLVGRHQLGIRFSCISGTATDPSNKGFRVWYRLTGQGDTPPATPDDLIRSFYTKRKKDVIDFDFADSGKTAWMAVQVENEGKKGPWGPIVSALIP